MDNEIILYKSDDGQLSFDVKLEKETVWLNQSQMGELFDKDTDTVVFECSDNGPGIPESIRQDIFKPFFTTKEVGKGTGLGLYICHEIIQRHGGTITIEKPDGEGTKFVVKLPVNA